MKYILRDTYLYISTYLKLWWYLRLRPVEDLEAQFIQAKYPVTRGRTMRVYHFPTGGKGIFDDSEGLVEIIPAGHE